MVTEMKHAVIFPGQGSQSMGMGIELVERHAIAAGIVRRASDLLGWDLLEVCRSGPEEKLAETSIAQPALYVLGYAAWEVLRGKGLSPACFSGHSLGEYAAAAAAGAVSFEDGLEAVKVRGSAMSRAAKANPGGMLAVIGAARSDVEKWVKDAARMGVIAVANENSPEQVVVSGEMEALGAVEEAAGRGGARKVVRLKVSGAFHSTLMNAAAEEMRGVLAGMKFADPRIPVVGNVAADILKTAESVREELARQLVSSVRWEACVRTMALLGAGSFVEAGPGKVLCGLIRRIDKTYAVHATGSQKDLDETMAAVGEGGIYGKT